MIKSSFAFNFSYPSTVLKKLSSPINIFSANELKSFSEVDPAYSYKNPISWNSGSNSFEAFPSLIAPDPPVTSSKYSNPSGLIYLHPDSSNNPLYFLNNTLENSW